MKKYTLTTKGLYDFDTDLVPVWEAIAKNALTIPQIKEYLKEYIDCFAVSSKVERGMDDEHEIGKWIKALMKKGWVMEVEADEVAV